MYCFVGTKLIHRNLATSVEYGRIKERALVTVNLIYTLLLPSNTLLEDAQTASGKVLGLPFSKGKVLQGGESMYRISYSNEEGTDLYRVTLHVIGQTIILSRHILVIKIGMGPRVIVGCKDVAIHEIMDLGFIFPVESKPHI